MIHARRLSHLTAAAVFAYLAAAGFVAAGAAHAGEPAVRIIELPRVTVVAKRLDPASRPAAATVANTRPTRIVELPRVVIVAKRLQPSTTVIAERNLRASGG